MQTNGKQQDTKTRILSDKEELQDVEITMDEIKAEKASYRSNEEVSKEEVKAALEIINPDEGTLDRG